MLAKNILQAHQGSVRPLISKRPLYLFAGCIMGRRIRTICQVNSMFVPEQLGIHRFTKEKDGCKEGAKLTACVSRSGFLKTVIPFTIVSMKTKSNTGSFEGWVDMVIDSSQFLK